MHREKRTVEALSQRDFEVVSELRTEQSEPKRLLLLGSDGTVSAVERESGIAFVCCVG